MRNQKALSIFLRILKILLIVAMILPMIFFSYRLIESRISDIQNAGDEGYHSGYGLLFFLTGLVMLIVNGSVFLVCGITLLLLFLSGRKYQGRPKAMTWFSWFAIAPLANQMLYLLIGIVLARIG